MQIINKHVFIIIMKEYLINSKNGLINILEGDDIDNCKGIILHLHGLGSHFQYIYNSCDDLRVKDAFFKSHGYKAFALEFYGHGKSEGSLHAIYDFNDLIVDLENVINIIEKKHNNIFIIAESMGCAVAIKYIALRTHNIKGLILLSPMCGINHNKKISYCFERLLSYTSYLFPLLHYSIGTSIVKQSTNNKEYLQSICDTTSYPLCTMREILNVCTLIPKLGHLINCPTYILYGEDDNIICTDSIEKLYYNINNTKLRQVIKNKGHYLLIESNDKHLINFTDKSGKVAVNNPELILYMIVNWIDSSSCFA